MSNLYESRSGVLAEIQARLLAEAQALAEKARSPFNATGPRGDPQILGPTNTKVADNPVRRRRQARPKRWACVCKNYNCKCSRKGKDGSTQQISFKINKRGHLSYNRRYRKEYGGWYKVDSKLRKERERLSQEM